MKKQKIKKKYLHDLLYDFFSNENSPLVSGLPYTIIKIIYNSTFILKFLNLINMKRSQN